jgi:hypothetical protein
MNPDAGFLSDAPGGEWECMECGYVVEGAHAQRPVKCPDCGAPGEALEFFSYDDDAPVETLYDEDDDDDLLDDDDERP